MKMFRVLLALNVTLFVVLGGPALGQDTGTLDKDQVKRPVTVERPAVGARDLAREHPEASC